MKGGTKGWRRIVNAFGFSMKGFKACYELEEAFRQEVWKWEDDYLPGLSRSMKSFSEDLAKNSKEAFKDLKVLLRKTLKKV